MQPLPPAGWYPDPNGSAQQRWWNGQSWTNDLAPVAAAPAEAMAATPAAEPGYAITAPAAYSPQPHAPQAFGGQPHNGASYGTQPYGSHGSQPYGSPHYAPAAPATGWARNRYALITFGIVALYLFIAVTSGVAILGILPLMMSIRSQQAREPFAPFAIGAAILAIIVAVTILSGH